MLETRFASDECSGRAWRRKEYAGACRGRASAVFRLPATASRAAGIRRGHDVANIRLAPLRDATRMRYV